MADLVRRIVIHFDGETAEVPVDQLARECSVSVGDVGDALTALIEGGWLTARDDGAFDATVPDDAQGTE